MPSDEKNRIGVWVLATLAEGVEASLRIADASRERIESLSDLYKVGDELSAVISNLDRRNRVISLSVKQLEINQEKQALDQMSQQSEADISGPTTIGDLIKAQLQKDDSK